MAGHKVAFLGHAEILPARQLAVLAIRHLKAVNVATYIADVNTRVSALLSMGRNFT